MGVLMSINGRIKTTKVEEKYYIYTIPLGEIKLFKSIFWCGLMPLTFDRFRECEGI